MTDLEQMARRLFLDQCLPGDRGAIQRHGEKAAVAAIVAALSLSKQVLVDLLNSELSDSYDCSRVWSAWGYGTMGEDDFHAVTDRVDEIACGLIDAQMAALLAIGEAEDAPEPFPQPQFKAGNRPCGECHLNVGEDCSICGAVQHAPGSEEWLRQSPQFHPGDLA